MSFIACLSCDGYILWIHIHPQCSPSISGSICHPDSGIGTTSINLSLSGVSAYQDRQPMGLITFRYAFVTHFILHHIGILMKCNLRFILIQTRI